MLSSIKSYLRNQKSQSLLSLSKLFGLDSAVLRDMLSILVRKGQVRMCQKTLRCGTQCIQCDPLATEMYEWVEEEGR